MGSVVENPIVLDEGLKRHQFHHTFIVYAGAIAPKLRKPSLHSGLQVRHVRLPSHPHLYAFFILLGYSLDIVALASLGFVKRRLKVACRYGPTTLMLEYGVKLVRPQLPTTKYTNGL